MATETVKGTLRAIAVSISTPAIALFLDALFWRVLFLLGEVLTHLGATLRAAGSVGRGPPVEPQRPSLGKVEGKNGGDAGGMHGCSQSGNEGSGQASDAIHCRPQRVKQDVRGQCNIAAGSRQGGKSTHRRPERVKEDVTDPCHIHEGSRQGSESTHRRPERVKEDVTDPCHIHKGNRQGSESIHTWPEWVNDDVRAPSPISSHSSEGNVPTFICNVGCHRPWKKWYAVMLGWHPGLYNCWDCVEPELRKFSGKKDKAFRLRRDAENFLRIKWHCLRNH